MRKRNRDAKRGNRTAEAFIANRIGLMAVPVFCACAVFSAGIGECWGQQGAASDGIGLDIAKHSLGAKLQVSGSAGSDYAVHFNSGLGEAAAWNPLAGFTLPSDDFELIDPGFLSRSRGFYRLEALASSIDLGQASNFRLIDHEEKSRELYYNEDQNVMVLIFADLETLESQDNRDVIKDLKTAYSDKGVMFWLVNSDPETGRDGTKEAGKALGLGLPFLYDTASLSAREFGVRSDFEAIAIDVASWTILYRGAIEGPATNGETIPLLAHALEASLGGQTVEMALAPVGGSPLILPPLQPVSYADDVAPILLDKCVRCHSPGNVGPFAMTDYQVAADWSLSMKSEILVGRMPPWHADPHYGKFTNDLSLSPEQKVTMIQWINEGAQRGDGPDPLGEFFASGGAPLEYPAMWPAELGEPDYVVTIPKQHIPADGEVDYRYPTVAVDLPNDVWLRAAVVLPGNQRVVHHVLVSPGTDYSFLNYIVGYAPGTKSGIHPAGSGTRLKNVTHLSFEVHYETTGEPETDETKVGLYFHEEPPETTLHNAWPLTLFFRIPSSAKEYQPSNATFRFERDALLHTLQPHMHFRGLRMKYEAAYPDGTREVLLNVPNYSFDWQTTYVLAEPKQIPAGTRITVSGAFDNSALNHHNPDPRRTVTWGEQTTDEMFIGFMSYTFAE